MAAIMQAFAEAPVLQDLSLSAPKSYLCRGVGKKVQDAEKKEGLFLTACGPCSWWFSLILIYPITALMSLIACPTGIATVSDTTTNTTTGNAETPLILQKNLSHNVLAHIAQAKISLAALATVYLVTEAAGHSHATLDAKRRDLQRFLSFYERLYKHDRPEEWFVSVTKAFLKALQREKLAQPSRRQQKELAQASLVRIYATVRHFARWLHRKFPDLFPLGCPTEGVKPPAEPTPDWKGLTRLDEIRLDAAAQTLRARPGHGTNQGLRNHALLAVLLGSGLRVSEALSLDRNQYTGKGFARVQIKGGNVRDFVPVHREARKVAQSQHS
jgi:site-specific recombinase XerD